MEICAEIDLGASNKEDWKIGSAERTALIKINFPALVNHWTPQEVIFPFKLAINSSQREGGGCPRVKGSLKYFIFSDLSKPGKPKKLAIQRIAE